ADLTRNLDDFLGIVGQGALRTRNHRHAGFDHGVLGADLVAHDAYRFRTGADEHEAAFLDAFGKIRVLSQETVSGMDGFGIGHLGRRNDGRHVQVAVAGRRWADAHGLVGQTHVLCVPIGFRVHHHRLDAQFAAGALYAQGDLAAIGNEDFFKHELANNKQGLTVFDRLAVLDQDFLDDARLVGLDFVQQFHGFNNAEGLAFLDGLADFDEWRRAGIRRAVERADHGCLDDMAGRRRCGGRCRSCRGCRRGSRGSRFGHIGDGLYRLRELDDPDLAFALGDFEFGNTRLGDEIDQGFEFSYVHKTSHRARTWTLHTGDVDAD